MALQVPLKTASIEEKAKYVWDTADTALEDEVDSSYIFQVLQKKCHDRKNARNFQYLMVTRKLQQDKF